MALCQLRRPSVSDEMATTPQLREQRVQDTGSSLRSDGTLMGDALLGSACSVRVSLHTRTRFDPSACTLCVPTHLALRTAFRRRSPTCNRPSPLWPDGGRWVAKGRARVAGVRAPRVAALSPSQVGGRGTESWVQSHVYRSRTLFLSPGGRLNVDRRQELFELRVPYAQAARFAVSGGTETGTTFVAAEHGLP